MKNINLSIDGGGTGIRILAFDEELKLLGRGFSGPVNATFENEEKVGGNISEALKILFDPLPKNLKIHKIFKTLVGSSASFGKIFMGFAKERGIVTQDADICEIREGHSHILAASLGEEGGVALSGTGSGAIYCSRGKIIHLGGCGVPVGDEGSGAWIGLQAMSAVMKELNGWGEETALTKKLYEYLQLDQFGSITGALYKKGTNQQHLFAGFCRAVAECERSGDKVAREIIYRAGKNMGLQMIAALKRAESANMLNTQKKAPEIYASGGAWKSTPYMFLAMKGTIQEKYPGAICKYGLFDPVMAGVIKFVFETTGKNTISHKTQHHLQKEFDSYLFKFEGAKS